MSKQKKMSRDQLAVWIGEQKIAYARGTLSKERIAQLESIPGWTWLDENMSKWLREIHAKRAMQYERTPQLLSSIAP